MSGRTIVVGGGLSGLAAAWTLARLGREVLVLEASERSGGAVRTEHKEGFLLEIGPNTVRPARQLWSLVQEIGIADQVLLSPPRVPRYVDFGGRLHAVPASPGALLTTGLLSARGKLRLIGEPFCKSPGPPDESVRDFVARRLGPEAADRLIEPFVAGIFAGSAEKLSAAAAFPTLLEWEREHGSLLRGAIAARRSRPTGPPLPRGLLSFRDGLETLPRALDLALGAALRTGVAVRAIAPHGAAGWTVSTDAGDLEAHRLVVAVPASRAAELVAGFAPEAARALSEIPHPPLAVLHLSWPESALGRRLDGFGHLVCPDPRRRILGAVWSSALFPGRAPAGQALFTVFFGGTRDPEGATLPDDELTTLAARDFESEGLTRGSPRMVLATRWPRAIPQYERGHAGRIAALAAAERRWPGLHLLGNYRGGISVADVVRAGMEIT